MLNRSRFSRARLVHLLCLGVFQTFLAHGLFAQMPIFSDIFENGSVTNSESITGFWTPSVPASGSVAETGGKLIMTAGSSTSANGVFATYLYSPAASDEFNFFKKKLSFAADVSITGQYGAVAFALTGVKSNSYSVDDALVLSLSIYNTVTLSTKQDRPNTSSSTVNALVNGVDVGGPITRFELTLDAVNYTLVVSFQGGTGSKTFTGPHGLIAAQWGTDGMNSMQFSVTRGSGGATGAGITVTGTVDNFLVTSYAPAALFEDSFANGVVAHSNLETGIWSSTLPFTSTVSESTGSLVQTASATDASFVVNNLTTPRQSRFNFFDQQLKVSATVTVTGSASAGWMERGRLVLASQAGLASTAGDALTVGFRAQNNITLITKTDAGWLEPDNVNDARNHFLLNGSEAVGIYSGDNLNRFDLILNAKRYRLIGYNPGKASGIVRFSGAHNLDRSKWGTNGDSALVLETIRTSAAAGTATVTTWDNLRVESDTTKLLDEPFWSFSATYSTSLTTTATESGTFRVWVPATEPTIRGVIFIGPGDGEEFQHLVHDPAAQEAARELGFALIGYTTTARMNLGGNNPALIKSAVQTVLDRAAAVSGRPEIANAPLCATGLSRGAFDSCFLARNWPERVITIVPHCGGEWNSFTMTNSIKSVPVLFIAGSTDTNSATSPYQMQDNFNWWRSQGGLAAYAIDWNVPHSMRGNQGFEATWVWMTEIAKLRYPRPMLPTQTYGSLPTLLNIPESAGWLGTRPEFYSTTTPSLTHTFATISSYSTYSGSKSNASWLPSETMARAYRAMNSTDGVLRSAIPTQSPVRIVTPAQFAEPITAGSPVSIEVDPRDFDNTNVIVSMDFYDGSTWLGALTSGPSWKWTFTPAVGFHSLSVVATDALGNKRDAFRVIHVLPTNFAPTAYRQTLTATSTQAISAKVSALDPEGDAVTYALAQQPLHGTATVNATTGDCVYQANPGFGGTDTFTFTASDGTVTSTPATIQVTVTVPPVSDIATITALPASNAGQITLTWSAASDAASYQVERSTSSLSGFLSVATVSAPAVSYTDTGLTLGQNYFYRVRAINSISQSNYSALVSAKPYTPPTSASWRYANFGSTEIITGTSGDLDSPNHDGISNLMKCALGINLYDSNGNQLAVSPTSMPYVQPQEMNGESYLTCSFTHNKDTTDLHIQVEVANDPSGPWTQIDPFLPANQMSRLDDTPSSGMETIVVKDTQPLSAASKRFMRFKVIRP
ncbi:MAG: hypothetical protein B9S32_04365 [Verrucomicrobia bacterium Tous-C9LFEB]|nr:MAG: hypothetical protein B9S32_04365 [Verrucomicrobia bacterium Tous-C9LFEB]